MAPRLPDRPALFVDCQSTGATPAHGSLLELGWAWGDGAPGGSLVALPEGAEISRQVTRVTGLRADDLSSARPAAAVWADLEAAIEGLPRPVLTVIHFAVFEERWLRALHASQRPDEPFPFDIVCTHQIAKRLFPDLPRRGLRALAGYFGSELGMLRRSADHVRATRLVWRAMTQRLADRGAAHDLAQLRAWIAKTPVGRSGARGFPMPKEERAGLPKGPGVYRMLRVDGSLLYVGKARSLKKRVSSYFHRRAKIPERTLEMLSQARRLDWTPTSTPLEAALLEQEQIKDRAPPYNVALRGDTRRCWFADRGLRELVDAPDDAHPVGPVTDQRLLEGLAALRAAIAGEMDPETASARDALTSWGPPPEVLAEGIARFRARHPRTAPTLRGLLSLGRRLWPLARDDDDDDDDADETSGWTPDSVANGIEDRWARAAHAIRHARWLSVLSESSVAWTVDEGRRVLVLTRGQLESRGWLEGSAPPPCPPGYARAPDERRRGFDVRTRDRLRVLTTELRRVVSDGREPMIRTGPGSVISTAALTRLLSLV